MVCQMVSTLVLLVIEYIFTIEAWLYCDVITESSNSGPMIFTLDKFFGEEIKLCLRFYLQFEPEGLECVS